MDVPSSSRGDVAADLLRDLQGVLFSPSSTPVDQSPPHNVRAAPEPILIAIFAYKGGVAKTTTTIELGRALAHLNHKTLIVDADSQCNLTSYFLHSLSNQVGNDGEEQEEKQDNEETAEQDKEEMEEQEDDRDDVQDTGKGKEKQKEKETDETDTTSVEASDEDSMQDDDTDVTASITNIPRRCPMDRPKRDVPVVDLRNDTSDPSLLSLLRPAFRANVYGLQPFTLQELHQIHPNLYLLRGHHRIVELEQSLHTAEPLYVSEGKI